MRGGGSEVAGEIENILECFPRTRGGGSVTTLLDILVAIVFPTGVGMDRKTFVPQANS